MTKPLGAEEDRRSFLPPGERSTEAARRPRIIAVDAEYAH